MEFLAELQSPAFWHGLLLIIWVNIILSGDNAVVIALAARSLPPEQQKKAVLWGAGAAVVLRIFLTIVAVKLLTLPYLKIIGGLLLFWIAIKLLNDAAEDEAGVKHAHSLWSAIWFILVADITMSTDNIIAVAALDRSDKLADFSSFGANSVHLGAPGVGEFPDAIHRVVVVDRQQQPPARPEHACRLGKRAGGLRDHREDEVHHHAVHAARAQRQVHAVAFDQFDVEHQHAGRSSRHAVVGDLLRNPEAALLSRDHQLHTFTPALDHAIHGEGARGKGSALQFLPF